MTFANPLGLLVGLLAIPIVLLHILKPRREEVEVSSTYLWRDHASPVSASAPWQRLKPSVLLALQLLAVALLALAVARPGWRSEVPLAQHTVFVLDASGSMGAADGTDELLPDQLDGSRLAAASRRAQELYDELPDGGVASIVVASPRPRVLLSASSDAESFAAALAKLPEPGGAADFASAFTLGESLETPGTPIGFVLLSDGGLTDLEQAQIPLDSRYERIGRTDVNRAITGFVVETRGTGLHAIVTLENTGGADATQELRIDVDGVTHSREVVVMPEGETVTFEADLPDGERVEAFLEGDDLLAADNRAFAVAGSRRDLAVLHVGPPNAFLDQFLAVTTGLEVTRSESVTAASDFDLVIYDRVDPPDNPDAPAILIAPIGGFADVAIVGESLNPVPTLVRSDRNLLDGLDFSDVAIASAQRVDPGIGDVLIGAEATPLLINSSHDSRPFSYLTFALGDSNFPVQIAFPILFDRLLAELTGAALPPSAITVGRQIPIDTAEAHVVTSPGGTELSLPAGSASPRADRVGFWKVTDAEGNTRLVAVNESPGESKLNPAVSLPIETSSVDLGERRELADGLSDKLAWVAWPLLSILAAEWLWSRRRIGVTRPQWRIATVTRAVVAALIIGALLGITITRSGEDVATVFLIDGSDSLGPAGQTEAVEWVREALAQQPDGARSAVAAFGGDARLELTMKEQNALGGLGVEIDTSQTDLAEALRLGGAVLPSDTRRRIVLVSDGRQTTGDPVEEAQILAVDGVQIDVHTVGERSDTDVAIRSIDAPGLVREGELVQIEADVVATQSGEAVVTLFENGERVDSQSVALREGSNRVVFERPAEASGLVRYEVRSQTASDTIPQNDRAFAAVSVEGPARALLVEGSDGSSDTLAQALLAGGVAVEQVNITQLPPIDELAQYAAIVLVDVDARLMADAQVEALATATRDLGRGLVTIGGDQSYGLGGYLNSELEELLPVISEITDPLRRQSVAEVLAIDTSGSMGACHCAEEGNGGFGGNQRGPDGGVNKTDIARTAAARAIEALADTDEVGVLSFDSGERWILDLQQTPGAAVVNDALGRLTPSGGTDISESLSTSAEALRASNASLKHIILFTDGFTEPNAMTGLADQAAKLAEEGITVSVVATGEGAARELQAIAEAGNGRFYPGRDLQRIPQIIMEEAVIASRDFIIEGEFSPVVTSNDRVVAELEATPPILGYVGTTSKPAASTLLRIGPDNDPLLATWQVGLGRATSWTSDSADRWSQLWTGWDGYVDFWTTVVKDTFPTGDGGNVRAQVADGVLRVTVEGEDDFAEGAAAVARVSGPDGETREVQLRRVSGDRYEGEIPVDDAGTYAVGASVDTDGTVITGTSLANLSFSEEYLPGAPDAERLTRLSDTTGGRGEIDPSMAFDRAELEAGRSSVLLAPWLLLAAALLWPVAVALSRLNLRTSAVGYQAGRLFDGVRTRVPGLPGRDRTPRPVRSRPKVVVEETVVAPPSETLGRLLKKKRGEIDDGDAPGQDA